MSGPTGVACINPKFQTVTYGRMAMEPLSYIGKPTAGDAAGSCRVIEVDGPRTYSQMKSQLRRNGLDEIFVSGFDGKHYLIVGRMLESYVIEGGQVAFQLGENGPLVRGIIDWYNIQDSPQGLLQIIGKAVKVRLEDNPPTKFDSLSGLAVPSPAAGGVPGRQQ